MFYSCIAPQSGRHRQWPAEEIAYTAGSDSLGSVVLAL